MQEIYNVKTSYHGTVVSAFAKVRLLIEKKNAVY